MSQKNWSHRFLFLAATSLPGSRSEQLKGACSPIYRWSLTMAWRLLAPGVVQTGMISKGNWDVAGSGPNPMRFATTVYTALCSTMWPRLIYGDTWWIVDAS
jgi:hypothetical protein